MRHFFVYLRRLFSFRVKILIIISLSIFFIRFIYFSWCDFLIAEDAAVVCMISFLHFDYFLILLWFSWLRFSRSFQHFSSWGAFDDSSMPGFIISRFFFAFIDDVATDYRRWSPPWNIFRFLRWCEGVKIIFTFLRFSAASRGHFSRFLSFLLPLSIWCLITPASSLISAVVLFSFSMCFASSSFSSMRGRSLFCFLMAFCCFDIWLLRRLMCEGNIEV